MKQSLYQLSVSWFPGACLGLRHRHPLPGRGDYTQVTSMQPVGHGQGEFAKEKVVVRSGPWDPRDFWGFLGLLMTFETKHLWLVIQSTCKSGCSKVGFMWRYYYFGMFFWGMTDRDSAKNWYVNESMLLLIVFWQQTSELMPGFRGLRLRLFCVLSLCFMVLVVLGLLLFYLTLWLKIWETFDVILSDS